ncbi:PA0069 family radical SAM protein [Rhodoblastus sp.]|uniref:PA0069 family radical SAM protein n=1 Tax=Rhodoblastus sp. TaxID=1962975 RepID=UPI003F98817B
MASLASHPALCPAPGAVSPSRRRGRSATSNPSGRFEKHQRVDLDDGWGVLDDLPPFRTEIVHEKPRTLITRNDSPDIAFERSINPYRGCEHGCIYCFARPSHAFLGLSPGLDFESRLFVKDGAADALRRELAAPGYQPRVLAIGTNTDPYQPIEREYRVMRGVLEVLAETNHPVAIVTKSALVLRDLDLLAPMAEKGLVKVALSVTTLDRELARAMEPRAATPSRRLAAIEKLSQAGVPTAVMVAPVIPGVTDHEIETILARAYAHGAREAGYILLRLPLETRDLFANWLLEHFPDKYRKVLALLRSTRDGKLYDSAWGKRMTGTGPYAWTIGRRFELASARLGLSETKVRLRTDLFTPPERGERQLSLF